jgi:hypothetical protein
MGHNIWRKGHGMTDHSKRFDRVKVGQAFQTASLRLDPVAGAARTLAEGKALRAMLDHATPPEAMRAAPIAPARGPQAQVPNFTVTSGGMRRVEGMHWRALSPLAAAVAQARQRHEARKPDAPFVPPYSPAQVAMAELYAALVEWRDGSAMKCASLEAGREGGGSGHFIDSFMDRGRQLAELQARIGDGVAMDVRRHMDRGNGRARITVRAVVDMVCLGGVDLSEVLRRFGWAEKGEHRRQLRDAIRGALDRMQGYRD